MKSKKELELATSTNFGWVADILQAHQNKFLVTIENTHEDNFVWNIKTGNDEVIASSPEAFSAEGQCVDNLRSLGMAITDAIHRHG